jgi:Ca2+/Na+ antiporter
MVNLMWGYMASLAFGFMVGGIKMKTIGMVAMICAVVVTIIWYFVRECTVVLSSKKTPTAWMTLPLSWLESQQIMDGLVSTQCEANKVAHDAGAPALAEHNTDLTEFGCIPVGKDTLTMYPSHFVITHNTGICNIALTSAQTYTGTLYKHVKWARFATNRRDPAELGYQLAGVSALALVLGAAAGNIMATTVVIVIGYVVVYGKYLFFPKAFVTFGIRGNNRMTCRVPQSAIPDIRAVMEKQILGYQQSDEAIKEWEGRDAGMLCSPAPYSTFTLRPASLDLKIEQRPKGKCHFKCMIPADTYTVMLQDVSFIRAETGRKNILLLLGVILMIFVSGFGLAQGQNGVALVGVILFALFVLIWFCSKKGTIAVGVSPKTGDARSRIMSISRTPIVVRFSAMGEDVDEIVSLIGQQRKNAVNAKKDAKKTGAPVRAPVKVVVVQAASAPMAVPMMVPQPVPMMVPQPQMMYPQPGVVAVQPVTYG